MNKFVVAGASCTIEVYRIEGGNDTVVGIGLVTKLEQYRGEQATEVLLLILPEIVIVHCETCKPRFLYSLDFLDDRGTSRYCEL